MQPWVPQEVAANPLKYCFVTYGSLPKAAAYVRALGLATELVKAGHRAFVMADSRPENVDLLSGNAFEPLFIRGSNHLTRLAHRRRIVKALRPDGLHLLNPIIQNCMLAAGNRGVNISLDWDEPPTFGNSGSLTRWANVIQERWMAQRADLAIACNRAIQAYLRERYGIEALYLPHAMSHHEPEARGEAASQEPCGVYMGTFSPNWDQDLVFEALFLLARRGVHPRVEFIGEGPDMERWRRYVSRYALSNIVLSGYLPGPEMRKRLREAHYLLFPIRNTPFNQTRCPSKVFAYAQSARPIVTNRVGEVAEILRDRPIYIPASVEAFAGAIEQLSSSPRLPDVDYEMSQHTFEGRSETLLAELTRRCTSRPQKPAFRYGIS